jgi:YD repeat-containing protein
MFPLPERADPFLPIPAGGQVKTFFNDTDQPVEWQVVDASGNLLNRLIRSYDAKGRVTEVSYPLENSPMSLPEEDRQQFLAEPGTEEEFAKQLVKLLGAKKEFVRTTYAYDAKGRLAERRCCIGRSMEMVTTTTYNDHSDKLEESSTTFGDPNQPRNEGTGEFPATGPVTTSRQSQMRYSYKYDSYGNWTEQSASPTPSPEQVTVVRRTIKYF